MATSSCFATVDTNGSRDSSAAPAVQLGSRRSSRKAKPTKSFFDLQASTLWSGKRRASTAFESAAEEGDGTPPDEKSRCLDIGRTDRGNGSSDTLTKPAVQKAINMLPPKEDSAAAAADSVSQKLREQQRWLIESIKEGAINAFAKIVEHRLHPSASAPPEPAANSEPESAAQLAQRLELMTRQHAVETAELQMLHQLQLAELRHNHTVALCEHRAALDLEKQAALAEALRFQESEMARQIEAVKSRQWCATCDREAFFYCCWNTSYCDAACQQRHWPAHMATCAQRGSQVAGRR
uniref:MYND-type domain-containing protein n=1 Tax=Macrostomum lignano TaxID=282301 RepID=A0A1I8ITZ6_9PLAT